MRITRRLESVCVSARLLPEDAIAIVQEVGRSAVRQIDDGRRTVEMPGAGDLFIDSYGDVGWDHAVLVEPSRVVAGLADLLEALLRIAEETEQYHVTPSIALIIGRATGAADTDPFASPLEFLRTLDRLGPVDNNAAIRDLYHRSDRVPHTPVVVEPAHNREALASALPRFQPPAPALSRQDVRDLTLTTLAAIASMALFVPVLMGMTPPVPASAAGTIAARDIRLEWPLPPSLPTRRAVVRPRAASRGARAAAAPILFARDVRPLYARDIKVVSAPIRPPSQRRASLFTRLLAGDGRHRIQPFPRPTGLD